MENQGQSQTQTVPGAPPPQAVMQPGVGQQLPGAFQQQPQFPMAVPAHAARQYAPAQFHAYSPATPVAAGLQPAYNQITPIQTKQAPYVPRINPTTGAPFPSVWRDRHDEEKKKSTALETQLAAEQKARNDLYQELLAARVETAEAKRATEFEKKMSAVKGGRTGRRFGTALIGTPGEPIGKAVHFDKESEDEFSSPDGRKDKKKAKDKKKKKKKGKKSKLGEDNQRSNEPTTNAEDQASSWGRPASLSAGAGPPAIAGWYEAMPAKMTVTQVSKKFKTKAAKQKLRMVLVQYHILKPEDAMALTDEKAVELAAKAHRDGVLDGVAEEVYTVVECDVSGGSEGLVRGRRKEKGGKKLYGGLRARGMHNYFMLPLGVYRSRSDCDDDERENARLRFSTIEVADRYAWAKAEVKKLVRRPWHWKMAPKLSCDKLVRIWQSAATVVGGSGWTWVVWAAQTKIQDVFTKLGKVAAYVEEATCTCSQLDASLPRREGHVCFRTTELTGKFQLLNKSLKDTPSGGGLSTEDVLSSSASFLRQFRGLHSISYNSLRGLFPMTFLISGVRVLVYFNVFKDTLYVALGGTTGLRVQVTWECFLILMQRLDAYRIALEVEKLPIQEIMLRVTERLFAASSRVTQDHWITPYAKQDNLNFCFTLSDELFASILDFNLKSCIFCTPYVEDCFFGTKNKFAFLAPQSALGFEDRSKAARFDVSILLIQNRAAARLRPVTRQGIARVERAYGAAVDDRGAGGALMREVEAAGQTRDTAGGIADLEEYWQAVRGLNGLARGTLDRNTAVGFGVCEKIYQGWLRQERDGGNYERVERELATVVEEMQQKYRGAELMEVATFDAAGKFGNLYLSLKHKDVTLWEKRRPVVPGFATPDWLLQNRIGRCLCFLLSEIPGHFNVATTQEIGERLAAFNAEVGPGDWVMAAGFDVKEMYVRLTHPQALRAAEYVVTEAMQSEDTLLVNRRGRKGVQWHEPGTPTKVAVRVTRELILAGVQFILGNGFLNVAGILVRQTCGIGIGGKASPGLAQCVCVYGEMKWTASLWSDMKLRRGETLTGVRLMDDCTLLLRGDSFSLKKMRPIFWGYVHECYPKGMTVEQTSDGLEWTFCGMKLTVRADGVSTQMLMRNVAAGVTGGVGERQLQFFPIVGFSSACPRAQKMASTLNVLYRIEGHCSDSELKAVAITDLARELLWQSYPEGWLFDALERMVSRVPFGFWNRLVRRLRGKCTSVTARAPGQTDGWTVARLECVWESDRVCGGGLRACA
ncbi:hypothetical protein CYMTET_39258 [Cymbomonas tetramitiformis]|uniref:Uncharacterized protein n=1 Tax=Cymbomonas tetramitiformis TaxID=36881 RepID=A0AAE0CBL2_9CHLO|nr:hypothetical protein CYMTET_39258 [Cymbomonas tetramitiformis]